jgi:hypothetical protein
MFQPQTDGIGCNGGSRSFSITNAFNQPPSAVIKLNAQHLLSAPRNRLLIRHGDALRN